MPRSAYGCSRLLSTSPPASLLTWQNAHTDAVTCLDASVEAAHLFVSGGADGVVKLWDTRVGRSSTTKDATGVLNSFRVGGADGGAPPVTGVKFCSMGTVVLASAGCRVWAWDVRNNESRRFSGREFLQEEGWRRVGRTPPESTA